MTIRLLSISELPTKILVGCGNPLLDVSATVNKALIQKYELPKNQAIMAEEKHKPLYRELIRDYKVEYTAGGSAQNSMRACQWILQKPYTTVFFGCVGRDRNAKILRRRAQKDGVIVRYQTVKDVPTGTCMALITGTHRTLVARLSAAEHFHVCHLHLLSNRKLVQKAKYFYISGYFLVSSLESVMKLAVRAAERNSCFTFNLSAVFVSQAYMGRLEKVIPFIDILFGNEVEAIAFSMAHGWNTTDHIEIGQRIQKLPKFNMKRSRLVIIHRGHLSVLVIGDDGVKEFEVPYLPRDYFVDTNGAGDCFVGGFLSQYILERSLNECIRCGIYTAQYIIGQSGVRFMDKPNFVIEN